MKVPGFKPIFVHVHCGQNLAVLDKNGTGPPSSLFRSLLYFVRACVCSNYYAGFTQSGNILLPGGFVGVLTQYLAQCTMHSAPIASAPIAGPQIVYIKILYRWLARTNGKFSGTHLTLIKFRNFLTLGSVLSFKEYT